MAGEIEEPCSFSFQADSFRSGSISFGRYENESLSWERRSSFLHNRYLEEVEKYSKPGSVIEKKAYFEAHFKKKGLGHQNSSESHNERENDTSDNEVLENIYYKEAYDNVNTASESAYTNGCLLGNPNYKEDNYGEERKQLSYVDDASHPAHFEDELKNVDYAEEFDSGNGESQFAYVYDSNCAYYDESSKGLEHRKECEVAACEVENSMVFPSDLKIEASMSKFNSFITDRFQEDGTQETEMCSGKSLANGEIEIEVNASADDINISFESSKTFNSSPKNKTAKKVDKSSLEHRQSNSAKLMAVVASKSTKPRLKSQVSTFSKGSSSDPSKTASKNQNIMEKESLQRTKREKQPSQAAFPTRLYLNRNAKKEDTEITKTKTSIESISEKVIRTKKVTEPQSSTSKVEYRAQQSPNRLKHNVASTKLDIKRSAATFNFKSSERADRRKGFYKNLEKEMPAKEAEMVQLQAITQATSSKHKPDKVQNKLNTGAAVISTPLFKAGNDWTLLAAESLSPTDPPEFSEASICNAEPSEVHALLLIPPTNTNNHAEAIRKEGIIGKKEQGKMQKRQVTDNNKMTKDLKVRGKLKAGTRRNNGEVASKHTRGIEIGNSSKMRHLTVGVAS